jgi:molybdenum cofactor sulfurtransferase
MGPIVTFNLKREDGTWCGYREVEKLASLSGINLRVRTNLGTVSSS